MTTLYRAVHAITAIGLLVVGGAGFLAPFGALPDVFRQHGAEELHLVQEASSGAIALGVLAAWCALRRDGWKAGHWALTVFFVLIGLLHAIDHGRGLRPLSSAVINSVPAAVFLGLWVLRPRTPSGQEADPAC